MLTRPIYTLLWADSEVMRIEAPTHGHAPLTIVFSAAQVRQTTGPTGTGSEVMGYLTPLRLTVDQPRVHGNVDEALGPLRSCELRCTPPAAPRIGTLPLPWSTQDPVEFTLSFRNGTELTVHGQGARCEPEAGARFHESMAC